MPGSLPSSSISRPIAPIASVPTITPRTSFPDNSHHPRHSHAERGGRQAEIGRHLGALLGYLLLDLLQRLVDRRLDQVLQQFLVAALECLVGQLAAYHLAAAVDAHLHQASAGVALGDDLTERLLEPVHFVPNLVRIVEQAEDLTELAEHAFTSPRRRRPPPGRGPAGGSRPLQVPC